MQALVEDRRIEVDVQSETLFQRGFHTERSLARALQTIGGEAERFEARHAHRQAGHLGKLPDRGFEPVVCAHAQTDHEARAGCEFFRPLLEIAVVAQARRDNQPVARMQRHPGVHPDRRNVTVVEEIGFIVVGQEPA